MITAYAACRLQKTAFLRPDGGTDMKSCQGVKYRCQHSDYRSAQTPSTPHPTASLHHSQCTHTINRIRFTLQQKLILAVRQFKACQRAFQLSEGPSVTAAWLGVTCIAPGHTQHMKWQAPDAAVHSYAAQSGSYITRKNQSKVSLSPFRNGPRFCCRCSPGCCALFE